MAMPLGRGEEYAGLPVWDVPEGGEVPGRAGARSTNPFRLPQPPCGRTPEKIMNEDPTATPVSDNETPPGATPAPETPADAAAPAADCAAFPEARSGSATVTRWRFFRFLSCRIATLPEEGLLSKKGQCLA